MSSETNKAIVFRYLEEVWNNGRLDLVEEVVAADFEEHNVPGAPELKGRDALQAVIGMIRTSLPDIHLTLHDVIAEGDKVVTSTTMTATHQGDLMGIPATGKQLTQSAAAIYRLADARIVELWAFPDNLGLMQQLGVVPMPEAA